MAQQSTILLDKRLIEMLQKAREHPRQTYNELIGKMLKVVLALRERNQYDEFLHKIQQTKMREIWDNKYDATSLLR